MDLSKFFEKVYCVNLSRRPDRWASIQGQLSPANWPFVKPERVPAIDGKLVHPPGWWKQGGGAWGCYRSHLRMIEFALNSGISSILLLEDDALLVPDFKTRVAEFLRNVPEDWDMLYLGGQHLHINQHPPKRINEWVYQPWNVNRTHAFALQGRMLQVVYNHLLRQDWSKGHHIDHHLGRLHQARQHRIYCPKEWLIGQAEGKSNISGKEPPNRFWPAAEELATIDPNDTDFVAVVGLHSSGSSALAGVLYHLGVHLGNELGGFYGNKPGKDCGYEAKGLAQLCEGAIPFPAVEFKWKKTKVWNQLKKWIDQRRREALKRGTIAGGKYPMLCRMGNQLLNICGPRLRLIHAFRPLEESIASVIRRSGKKFPPEKLEAHQRWLWEGKEQLLAQVPDNLAVHYSRLLEAPEEEISRIVEYLGLHPTPEQVAAAVASVKPEKRHIQTA